MVMTKIEKTLERMKTNPRDQRIEDLVRIADRLGIDHRQPGTSHVTFSHPTAGSLTVPAHKPIKPIYVRRFLELVDAIEED